MRKIYTVEIPVDENKLNVAKKIAANISCKGEYFSNISNNLLQISSFSQIWGLSSSYFDEKSDEIYYNFDFLLKELQKIIPEGETGKIKIVHLNNVYDMYYEQIFITNSEIYSINDRSITELVKKIM